eukprot:m.15920 g.15920  ORF g.15920 m.15920 type:complete len:103 (+) comp6787_c0_seq1:880-1188(+)
MLVSLVAGVVSTQAASILCFKSSFYFVAFSHFAPYHFFFFFLKKLLFLYKHASLGFVLFLPLSPFCLPLSPLSPLSLSPFILFIPAFLRKCESRLSVFGFLL